MSFINGIIQLKQMITILKYKIFNKIKTTKGTTGNKNKPLLIISLTTYPKRFNIVSLTIESLLNQTLQPDMIILYLATDEVCETSIPRRIARLQKRGLTIRYVNENIKSYKKLFYSLSEFPHANIVTVDDDILYPNWFLEKMMEKHKNHKNCIVAYRCTLMSKQSDNKLTPYLLWEHAHSSKPSFNLFFSGSGGVLYPPNSLNKKIFDKTLFLKLCPTGDDIWFKAMSLLNKTRVVTVFDKFTEFPQIPKSQEDALWKVNVLKNKNDEQIKNIFDYYDLYTYIT